MKLEENTIIMLSSLLVSDFMGENHMLAGEVDTLLHMENENHPEEQTVQDHIEAALRHVNRSGKDADSGLPHRAHVVSRLLLALRMVSRGE